MFTILAPFPKMWLSLSQDHAEVKEFSQLFQLCGSKKTKFTPKYYNLKNGSSFTPESFSLVTLTCQFYQARRTASITLSVTLPVQAYLLTYNFVSIYYFAKLRTPDLKTIVLMKLGGGGKFLRWLYYLEIVSSWTSSVSIIPRSPSHPDLRV